MAVGNQVGKIFSIPPASTNPSVTNISQQTISGGSLVVGKTYYLKYTFVLSNGFETGPSPETSITISGTNNAISSQISSANWVSGSTALNYYVGTASGQESYQGQVVTAGTAWNMTTFSTAGGPVPQWNQTSFQDINPSSLGLISGSEFNIHNIYYNSPISFGITDGSTFVPFDSDSVVTNRIGLNVHCNDSRWIRVFNNSSTNQLILAFDGMQTK